ncbi:MAG: CidA/LrgA family protein [Herpetosiphon sp.]
MIGAIALLLAFQLIGEVLVRSLGLPLPGPVLGMLLLFLVLLFLGEVPTALRNTSASLLRHLSLLFVPAGVGIMAHWAVLRAEWLPILAVVVGSTLLTMAATAWTMHLLLRLFPAPSGTNRSH